MHKIDRSRLETDKICQRSRFWQYDYNGTGIVPVGGNGSPDTAFGHSVHALIERPQRIVPVPVEGLTPDGHSQQEEWNALLDGLARTYSQFVAPQIDAEYEYIQSELETNIELAPGIVLMGRLDGFLRRKLDGRYFVLEAKTSDGRYVSDLKNGASKNFQLLLEVEALRRHVLTFDPEGVVGGAILLVFNKGTKQSVSAAEKVKGLEGHRRLGPFTYCYSKEFANGERKYQLEWKSGWDRTPTWTVPGWYEFALANWPDEVRGQVELVQSVEADPIRTASVVRQINGREKIVASIKRQLVEDPTNIQEWMDVGWAQNFAACPNYGGFRKPCKYNDVCFSPNCAANPLENGYERRVPNHPQETK